MNEAARIEECASGGRMLASEDLLERLEGDDAAALDLDPGALVYTAIGEYPTATEKARRDAATIAVCDLAAVTRGAHRPRRPRMAELEDATRLPVVRMDAVNGGRRSAAP